MPVEQELCHCPECDSQTEFMEAEGKKFPSSPKTSKEKERMTIGR
jgi:hypothetical protein